MHVIETTTVATSAGNYTIEFLVDEDAEQPEDEGLVIYLAGDHRRNLFTYGRLDDELAQTAIAYRNHKRDEAWREDARSGAAIVRYLRLKGHKGVTLIDRSFRPVDADADRDERVYGVAIAPSDATAPERYVRDSLAMWHAWNEGDVFGFRVLDPQGREVEGSIWGYYGFYESRPFALEDAEGVIGLDAAERVAEANRAGAGFVGVI